MAMTVSRAQKSENMKILLKTSETMNVVWVTVYQVLDQRL